MTPIIQSPDTGKRISEIIIPDSTPIPSVTVSDLLPRQAEFPVSFDRLVLPIDKPKGITSFDVIRHLRRKVRIKKIGHAGTLDPMATGLLICLLGKSTKRMNEFLKYEKTYTGIIRFGSTTPSYDADTAEENRKDTAGLEMQEIEDAATIFSGTILQQTPMYSAVRVRGERLYKKARRGEVVATPPRFVTIYNFQLGIRNEDDVAFTLTCSSGTYVRSIAHELGQLVGVGAHLRALCRTSIGPVAVDSAWSLDLIPSHSDQPS